MELFLCLFLKLYKSKTNKGLKYNIFALKKNLDYSQRHIYPFEPEAI